MTRERGTIQQAVSILGYEPRTVRAKAARGLLPGAAKMDGSWTFDLVKLRNYVAFKETEVCQSVRHLQAVSGAGTSYGAVSRPQGATKSGHYTQTIQRLRELAGKRTAIAR
jgi:hypothetical protein